MKTRKDKQRSEETKQTWVVNTICDPGKEKDKNKRVLKFK